MRKMDAEEVLRELFEADSLGITASMTDEQIDAIRMAYRALKQPESVACGYCRKFEDETSEGDGWCEQHDRLSLCDDKVCCHFEYGGTLDEE